MALMIQAMTIQVRAMRHRTLRNPHMTIVAMIAQIAVMTVAIVIGAVAVIVIADVTAIEIVAVIVIAKLCYRKMMYCFRLGACSTFSRTMHSSARADICRDRTMFMYRFTKSAAMDFAKAMSLLAKFANLVKANGARNSMLSSGSTLLME
jgi:hypothetical protein